MIFDAAFCAPPWTPRARGSFAQRRMTRQMGRVKAHEARPSRYDGRGDLSGSRWPVAFGINLALWLCGKEPPRRSSCPYLGEPTRRLDRRLLNAEVRRASDSIALHDASSSKSRPTLITVFGLLRRRGISQRKLGAPLTLHWVRISCRKAETRFLVATLGLPRPKRAPLADLTDASLSMCHGDCAYSCPGLGFFRRALMPSSQASRVAM